MKLPEQEEDQQSNENEEEQKDLSIPGSSYVKLMALTPTAVLPGELHNTLWSKVMLENGAVVLPAEPGTPSITIGSVHSGNSTIQTLILILSHLDFLSLRDLPDLAREAGDEPDATGGILLCPERGEPAFRPG